MNPTFHGTVVDYLKEEPHMAAELIWAATEGNAINVHGFLERHAVEELVRVMQYYEHSVASMWSAAALMAMATSYCGSGDPCVWKWNEFNKLRPTHTIDVDGLVARVHVMEIDGIWDILLDQVCSSVAFHDVHGVIMPSVAVKPSDSGSLVPWAMAGLIKALAVRKSSQKQLEGTVPCLCILSHSDDPLERRNAWEALYNLGREGACHTEDARLKVCVDMPFRTKDGLQCADFKDDCSKAAMDGDLSVTEACCVCGGGDTLNNTFVETKNDDL